MSQISKRAKYFTEGNAARVQRVLIVCDWCCKFWFCVQIIYQILDALAFMHSHGIMHCDLKVSNSTACTLVLDLRAPCKSTDQSVAF